MRHCTSRDRHISLDSLFSSKILTLTSCKVCLSGSWVVFSTGSTNCIWTWWQKICPLDCGKDLMNSLDPFQFWNLVNDQHELVSSRLLHETSLYFSQSKLCLLAEFLQGWLFFSAIELINRFLLSLGCVDTIHSWGCVSAKTTKCLWVFNVYWSQIQSSVCSAT